MKKVLALILAIVSVFSILAFAGCSDEGTEAAAEQTDLEYIKEKGTLVIGITLFDPMNFEDADGKMIGFDTELAEAVCKKLGVTPEFKTIDWGTKTVTLSQKKIDCIWNGMTITPEREENMAISIPYMQNKQVKVVKEAK